MIRPGRDRLNGVVEIDETFVGGPEKDRFGRGAQHKALVAIAVEVRGKGPGRIRLQRIDDGSADSLIAFVRACVEPGSTIRTDGWSGYANLRGLGFNHQVVNIKQSGRLAHEVMPRGHLTTQALAGRHSPRGSTSGSTRLLS